MRNLPKEFKGKRVQSFFDLVKNTPLYNWGQYHPFYNQRFNPLMMEYFDIKLLCTEGESLIFTSGRKQIRIGGVFSKGYFYAEIDKEQMLMKIITLNDLITFLLSTGLEFNYE